MLSARKTSTYLAVAVRIFSHCNLGEFAYPARIRGPGRSKNRSWLRRQRLPFASGLFLMHARCAGGLATPQVDGMAIVGVRRHRSERWCFEEKTMLLLVVERTSVESIQETILWPAKAVLKLPGSSETSHTNYTSRRRDAMRPLRDPSRSPRAQERLGVATQHPCSIHTCL